MFQRGWIQPRRCLQHHQEDYMCGFDWIVPPDYGTDHNLVQTLIFPSRWIAVTFAIRKHIWFSHNITVGLFPLGKIKVWNVTYLLNDIAVIKLLFDGASSHFQSRGQTPSPHVGEDLGLSSLGELIVRPGSGLSLGLAQVYRFLILGYTKWMEFNVNNFTASTH